MKRSWATWVAALLLAGCTKKAAQAPEADHHEYRDTEVVPEACDSLGYESESVDLNADGSADVVLVRQNSKPFCRQLDLNFDGQLDRTIFYDEWGFVRRIESDFDRDGKLDEIELLADGKTTEKQRVTTMDGRIDTWEIYEQGKLVRTLRDESGDGAIDQWWEYTSPECPLIHVDLDDDGRPDPSASIDYCKATGGPLQLKKAEVKPPAPPQEEQAQEAEAEGDDADASEAESEQVQGSSAEELPLEASESQEGEAL